MRLRSDKLSLVDLGAFRDRVPEPDLEGWTRFRLDQLWTWAREWAEAHGHVHNYHVVEGVAPL